MVEKTDTHTQCLVIGSGHSGLSIAGALKDRGVDAIILEQHAAIGDQWRNRYERLHLHHITDAMHLAGVPYPAHVPRYASRLDVAEYLEAYATLHQLDVRLEHRVRHLGQDESGGWYAEVDKVGEATPTRFTAGQVVLSVGATGITPRLPELPGREAWGGRVLHSCEYHNAEGFEGQRVLLVGSGNSAVEIACDLYDHGALPSLLVRGPNTWVTREAYAKYHRLLRVGRPILEYVPFSWLLAPLVILGFDRFLNYDVRRRYGDLSSKGIYPHSTPPMLRVARTAFAHPPTYVDGTWGDEGVSIFDLVRRDEVQVLRSEISGFVPGTKEVSFEDGRTETFDIVVLCTGFHPVTTHYETFVDPEVLSSLKREGVFRVWEEIPELPGLWVGVGGFVTARNALVILAERIAAKIQGRKAPARVLGPVAAFLLSGPDPGLLRVPKRTILLNLLAGAALIAFFAGLL